MIIKFCSGLKLTFFNAENKNYLNGKIMNDKGFYGLLIKGNLSRKIFVFSGYKIYGGFLGKEQVNVINFQFKIKMNLKF